MPIYEYECGQCGRTSTFLVRNTLAHPTPACPHCTACGMRRALSRFAAPGIRKSRTRTPVGPVESPGNEEGDDGMDPDAMGSLLAGLDENDPRSMGRMMRRLSETSGEPLDDELDEVTRRLEAGEAPESIDDRMGSAPDTRNSDTLYDG